MSDVDHPKHYNQGGIEVIDAIESWGLGFCLGNAIKYIARADHKGNRVQDIEKAIWYLRRYAEHGETRPTPGLHERIMRLALSFRLLRFVRKVVRNA